MNILYIGAGFVGTCSATISASSGHDVLVYDIDDNKIERLASCDRDTIETCLHEEGLADMIVRNKERLIFTADYNSVGTFLDSCDAIFLCLPTPEKGETGESELTYYFSAVDKLTQALKIRNNGTQEKYIVVVNKSTVPIDTSSAIQKMMYGAGVKNVGVVSNPEFLVEGKAIQGALKPDRVVIGADKEIDFLIMRKVYERFYHSPTITYIEVNQREAEAGKLLANYYLFQKLISCYDVIGRTCEAFDDIQFEHVRKILTADKRIGEWGFFDSLYAGGSCLIKDIRSLTHQLEEAGADVSLVREVYNGNRRQLEHFLSRLEKEGSFALEGKVVALLGVAFKRDTNDVRNSPSIDVMNFLLEKKVKLVNIYDPVAIENFSQIFPTSEQCYYAKSERDAFEYADVIIIATDWPQFRQIGDILLSLQKRPLLMDGRRMLQHRYTELLESGIDIIAVGSPFLSNKK